LSLDPAGSVDGLNRYLYVQNNPLNRIDPLGLAGLNANCVMAFTVMGAAAGAAGAAGATAAAAAAAGAATGGGATIVIGGSGAVGAAAAAGARGGAWAGAMLAMFMCQSDCTYDDGPVQEDGESDKSYCERVAKYCTTKAVEETKGLDWPWSIGRYKKDCMRTFRCSPFGGHKF
jgi:uncharacterized protein RhaS with RHS repeats